MKPKYTYKFEEHVYRFIKDKKLRAFAVAVSGGMDSMVLLACLIRLMRRKKIPQRARVFFFHHHTREGQDAELLMVSRFVEMANQKFQLSLDLVVFWAMRLDHSTSNFELEARKLRHRCFEATLQPCELILSAHHLDDAFEWYHMKSWSSSHRVMGLAFHKKPWLRPFLCVTKSQIKHYQKRLNIPYKEDPTNFDLSFERNYFRHQIMPQIQKKYPQYLKHFVSQMKFLKIEYQRNLNDVDKKIFTLNDIKNGQWMITSTEQDTLTIANKLVSLPFKSRIPFKKILHEVFSVDKKIKGPHFAKGLNFISTEGVLLIQSSKRLAPQEFKEKLLNMKKSVTPLTSQRSLFSFEGNLCEFENRFNRFIQVHQKQSFDFLRLKVHILSSSNSHERTWSKKLQVLLLINLLAQWSLNPHYIKNVEIYEC